MGQTLETKEYNLKDYIFFLKTKFHWSCFTPIKLGQVIFPVNTPDQGNPSSVSCLCHLVSEENHGFPGLQQECSWDTPSSPGQATACPFQGANSPFSPTTT